MPKGLGRGNPEFHWDAAAYQDTGCAVAPKCLTCPLSRCIYDEPNSKLAINRWLNHERDKRILQRIAAGEKKDVVARAEGMSTRAVYRIIEGRSVG